jgi:riboflavin kinase / FMN adenylyltransferase
VSPSEGHRLVSGTVIHGDQRGRDLGFPTANLRLDEEDRDLPFGVYAGRVDGRAAAISVGVRPTFGDGLEPLLEAHILDFSGDLYGSKVVVELVRQLRPEQAFESVAALVEQVHADIAAVRAVLAG